MPALRTAACGTLLAVVVSIASPAAASPSESLHSVPSTTAVSGTALFVGPLQVEASRARVSMMQRRTTCLNTACTSLRKRRWLNSSPTARSAPTTARTTTPATAPATAPVQRPAPEPVQQQPVEQPVQQPVQQPAAEARVVTAPDLSPATDLTRATAPRPVGSVPGLGAWAHMGEIDSFTNVGAYGVVQLNAWEGAKAAALKAAHPNLKVLVYKDMSSTRSYHVKDGRDDLLLPTGVGYVEAEASHPEWFLTDSSGARMLWPYKGHWWMDVASATYQQRWLANVSAELAAGPWDGVWIDNVMASPEWYLGGKTLAKYPTRASYEAATESFLRGVTPTLRDSGKLVVGNISDASRTTWDRWTGMMTGANHEHSFLWNNGVLYGGSEWLKRVQEIERTLRAGRTFTAMSEVDSTDARALTWVRASWLLAWDGSAGSVQMVRLKDRKDPWHPITTTALGLPSGARTAVGDAWVREYAQGTAVVNPSSSTVTVPLAGERADAAGQRVTSVVLAPLTAALLTR